MNHTVRTVPPFHPFHPRPFLLRHPLAGALAMLAGGAAACDSCGCHLPPELGAPHAGLSLGIFEQYADFSTLQEEGREIGNPHGQWLHSSTTQLIAAWRFDDAYAMQLFVPYIFRSFKRPNNGVEETGNVAGLGDVSLLGSARLWRVQNGDSAGSLTVRAGVKAPTGDPGQLQSERDGGGDEDPDNAVGGHDLALGSGSWDAVGGATAIGRLDDWYGVLQVLATWHSEGAYQYRMANEISATVSAGRYLWQDGRSHVAAQLNLEGESKGADTVAGEATDDTANHNLFVGPEIAAQVAGRWSGIVAVDLPIIERNSAVQLVPTWRLRAGVNWAF